MSPTEPTEKREEVCHAFNMSNLSAVLKAMELESKSDEVKEKFMLLATSLAHKSALPSQSSAPTFPGPPRTLVLALRPAKAPRVPRSKKHAGHASACQLAKSGLFRCLCIRCKKGCKKAQPDGVKKMMTKSKFKSEGKKRRERKRRERRKAEKAEKLSGDTLMRDST
ncbi:hypothetical protein QBC32DRAFT_209422 [Pseudoneurospora amorphoporcata]|uniref:Uncharacterized protein n=1 Tax=Pseudoneurospora amorphoporcata TaxID=241081 RepID=A0AAN6NXH6_9PEZI|nr:hypothetical protein QBC32DRAFT_209422 [Pseudoneurospora amorphoporcata]